MGYRVFIDDNFRYMDESERIDHGVFAVAEEAIAACRSIVNDCLLHFIANKESRITADDLFELYVCFGDDPFIRPEGPSDILIAFSARDYARRRCTEIAPELR